MVLTNQSHSSSPFVAFFFFTQKRSYDLRIIDWSSDVCSSDLHPPGHPLCDGQSTRLLLLVSLRRHTADHRRDGDPIPGVVGIDAHPRQDRKSTRLNSSH